MKIRDLIKITLGTAIMSMVIFSCSDDFSEKDLLQAQYDLASDVRDRNIAALNEAGELVSLQLKVVDTDGIGIAGLDVSMTAAAEGGVADIQTIVTDAAGLVFFDRVAIGGNSITISGTAILDVVLTAQFGPIEKGVHYEIVGTDIIPTPVTENAIVTVLGATTTLATVQGNVNIETDLTNATREVPQNVVLIADFNDYLTSSASFSIGTFTATNDNVQKVGTATVDNATGAYTMSVPAGVRFDLLIPQIQTTQRLAINGVDNVDLAQPEYRDVLTNFGPSWGTDGIPTVPGARIVFDAPGDGGEGFTLSLTRKGRSLPAVAYTSPTPAESGTDLIMQFTNYGSGYIASPTVTITDPTGTGAYARAEINVNAITAATIATGTGYAAAEVVNFDVVLDYYANSDDFTNNVISTTTYDLSELSVIADGTGEVTQAILDAAMAASTDNWFDATFNDGNNSIDNLHVAEIRLEANSGTAVATVTAADAEVFILQIVDGGTGYTAPSFAFSTGGAAITVNKFGTPWTYDVDNTGITTPYTLLPSSISFYYQYVSTGSTFEDNDGVSLNEFFVDGNGDIQFVNLLDTYETGFYSAEMPRVEVIETESTQASKYINEFSINADGQVSGMSTYSSDLEDFSNSNGDGYGGVFGATIEPTIAGAPGSGAKVLLADGDFFNSGEYQWYGDYSFTNQGSGYLQNLNVTNSTSSYSVGGSYSYVTLDEGELHIVDIRYGTGNKVEDVH
jgi:hypothetical protein